MSLSNKNIIIVGAGMGGSFLAIALAQKGYKISLYESRNDIRTISVFSDRSINQSLSMRGVKALEKIGLWSAVKKITIVEKGRIFHPIGKPEFFSPYGKNDQEVHYSFRRNELNSLLISAALSFKNIQIFFNTECVSIDKNKKIVKFKDIKNNHFSVKANLLIGADGINSRVRKEMHKNLSNTKTKHDFLEWGYKSFYSDSAKKNSLRKDVFHMWPRNKSALFAIANKNGSFVCTLMLPLEGKESFKSLQTENQINQFLKENFPEILKIIPNLVHFFKINMQGKFESIVTEPWYYKDFIVLIGDACHAIMPFYSQGVSATFDDCITLSECINKDEPFSEQVLAAYQQTRKKHTDVLTRLSTLRFLELKDKYRSSAFVARQEFEDFLTKKYPSFWTPLYTLISHTTLPYSNAYNLYKRREKIARLLGFDIFVFCLALTKNLKNKINTRIT